MKQINFFNMMVAVLILAMSVGFASCSKDNEEPEPDKDYSGYLIGKWRWYRSDINFVVTSLEFKADGTYSFEYAGFGSSDGYYRITEQHPNTKLSYEVDGYSYEYNNTILFKMIVSGNNLFDEWWVYYNSSDARIELINSYLNNIQVETPHISYWKEGSPFY